MSILKKAILLIFLILILDQTLKIWIKTHMMLGEEISVFGNWFLIHFTENNGMAFGLELAGESGKIILSLFRIAAIIGIGWYLYRIYKRRAHNGLILCIALILAGAAGNIFDSAFYGLIFSESNYQVATLFPEEGGYATFLHGKVVDSLYFPVIKGHFPEWFPIWRSEHFIFFRPVFNIADSSITIGVFLIIIFQGRFFIKEKAQPETEE